MSTLERRAAAARCGGGGRTSRCRLPLLLAPLLLLLLMHALPAAAGANDSHSILACFNGGVTSSGDDAAPPPHAWVGDLIGGDGASLALSDARTADATAAVLLAACNKLAAAVAARSDPVFCSEMQQGRRARALRRLVRAVQRARSAAGEDGEHYGGVVAMLVGAAAAGPARELRDLLEGTDGGEVRGVVERRKQPRVPQLATARLASQPGPAFC